MEDFEIIPIYTLVKRKNNKILRYLYSLKIPFVLRSYGKDINIIQQHQLFGSWVTIILKFIWKKPLFVRTGYDMYEFAIKENKKFYIKNLYKYLTKLALSFGDIYSVTSKSDARFLNEKFNINTNNIKIRPNWVKEQKVKKFNTRYSDKILCVGRLVNQKNYSFLFNELKDGNKKFKIDIVGTGPLKNDLELLAKENKIEVNFIGQLPNKDLIELYQEYKYFISSSLYEGNPKSLLEALNSGCVTLVSDIDNHREIINHKKNGFLFNFEKDSLKLLLEQIASDSKFLDNISNNAFSDIRTSNSIKSVASQYYDDYIELSEF